MILNVMLIVILIWFDLVWVILMFILNVTVKIYLILGAFVAYLRCVLALFETILGPKATLGANLGSWAHHDPSRTHFWSILDPRWTQTWSQDGPTWAHLEPTWTISGQYGANMDSTWCRLGANLSYLGPTWSQLGANLKPRWANLELTWAKLSQHGPNLGPDNAKNGILKNDQEPFVFLFFLKSESLQEGANLHASWANLSQHGAKVDNFEVVLSGFEWLWVVLGDLGEALSGFGWVGGGFERVWRGNSRNDPKNRMESALQNYY